MKKYLCFKNVCNSVNKKHSAHPVSFFKIVLCSFLLSSMFSSCVSLDDFLDGFIDDDNPDKVAVAIVSGITSVEKAAEEISPEMEYYIGRSVAANVAGKYKIYNSMELTTYLNKICSAITLNSPRPYLYKGYNVTVLDSKEINALATPGGHIFITTGLLKCTTCEDEIAAVLAHEISHIQLNHSINAIRTTRVKDALLKNLTSMAIVVTEGTGVITVSKEDIVSLGDAANDIAGTLLNIGFSNTQEFLADANALKLMALTGYDPRCMLDMLNQLKKNQGNGSGWSKTHPSPEARISNVNSELKKMKFTGQPKSVRQKRYESAMSILK